MTQRLRLLTCGLAFAVGALFASLAAQAPATVRGSAASRPAVP